MCRWVVGPRLDREEVDPLTPGVGHQYPADERRQLSALSWLESFEHGLQVSGEPGRDLADDRATLVGETTKTARRSASSRPARPGPGARPGRRDR